MKAPVRCLGLATAAVALVAASGCETNKAASSSGPAFEARFVAMNGAALNGAAFIRGYDGGVSISVNFQGRGPGAYRIVIHTTGNCRSYNGFSAGPPWAPPGVPQVTPIVYKADETAWIVARLPGYKLDGESGVFGRSVVIHEGLTGSLDAEPNVPNDRVGCGVIGKTESIFRD
jgi:Cu/Zn superoxide dismutase